MDILIPTHIHSALVASPISLQPQFHNFCIISNPTSFLSFHSLPTTSKNPSIHQHLNDYSELSMPIGWQKHFRCTLHQFKRFSIQPRLKHPFPFLITISYYHPTFNHIYHWHWGLMEVRNFIRPGASEK